MRFLRLLPFTALLLCACDKPLEEAKQQAYTEKTVTFEYDPEPSPEELAAEEAKIEELEREIENSTNLISDMEAFILMERAKIEDNPDYDQSFMEEALTDQNEERKKVEAAQKALNELQK